MALYRELEVYNRAYRLAVSLYKMSMTLPEEERYGLISQIQRAAVSIPANIAEGYSKEESKAELKRFLRIAKGSCGELYVLIEICADVGYLKKEVSGKYVKEIEEIEKMLHGLIGSV